MIAPPVTAALDPPADHHFQCDGRWSVWRDVVLRGAGFPVALLAQLSSAALGTAADGLLRAEAALATSLSDARKLCYLRLQHAGPDTRRYWRSVMRALQSGRVPTFDGDAADDGGDTEFKTLLARVAQALAAQAQQAGAFALAFAQAQACDTQNLRTLAADPLLREAVAWQNRQALQSGFDPLLRSDPATPPNAQTHKYALLVARYLQRYAAKNDTIGFFGPVGWAHIQKGDDLAIHHGPAFVKQASVDFEPWAIQTLATAIASDPALRPGLRPLAHPSWRMDGPGVLTVLERSFRLPPLESAIFALCDGQHTAARVVAQISAQPGRAAALPDEVMAALDRLVASKLVSLSFRVPLSGDSAQRLRTALCALPQSAARDHWLAGLDRLLELRSTAQKAFGDAPAVADALAQLDQCFTELTGAPPTHLAGATYGGRTLVCLDTRRDMDLHIGEDLVRELCAPLRPVLDAAYWFSCQAHAQLTGFVTGIFDGFCRSERMPLDVLWFQMQRNGSMVEAIINDVAGQVAQRWSSVTTAGPDPESAALLAPRVQAAFADAGPGWPGAVFQGPDIMLAATNTQAVQEGNYHFVLGELHAADRSLLRQVFIDKHPDASRLIAAICADQKEVELRPLMRNEAMLARTRTMPDAPFAFDIACDEIASTLPATRVLRSGELWVERHGGALRIRSSDGKHDFPLHAFLGPQTANLTLNRFSLFANTPYQARQTIDRLVVGRESWRVDIPALADVFGGVAEDRFRAVRRLALRLGWPRQVFYRVPGEPKPLYLDLDSPTYVELFARGIRAAATRGDAAVTVSEMLPSPAQCWLPDRGGACYASEWRMLFVRRRAGLVG